MSKLSTLGSPGVEVREIDNSLRVDVDPSTTYFVPGFAAQGPVEEVHSIGTMSDFENIYGIPTNEAERYFYHTVKSIIDNSGPSTTVYVSRLPYGAKEGDTVTSAFTLLSYPAVPIIKKENKEDVLESFKLKPSDEASFKKMLILHEYTGLTASNEIRYTQHEVSDFSYDIIIDEDYVTDKIPEIYIHNLYIEQKSEDGKTVDKDIIKLGTLPNSDDMSTFNGDVKLVYSIKSPKDNEEAYNNETVGKIAMEWDINTKTLLLHFAFNIGDEQSRKIGMMTISSEYSTFGDSKTKDYCFDGNTTSQSTFEFEDVYEIATSYDGQYQSLYEAKDYTSKNFAKDITYIVGAPTSFHISLEQYYKIITGDNFKWSRRPYYMGSQADTDIKEKTILQESDGVDGTNRLFGDFEAINHSAFIVINTSRSIINDSFEGFYFGMSDNMFISPSSLYTYDAIRKIKVTTKTVNLEKGDSGLIDAHDSTSNYDTIGENRLGFYLTDNHNGSISKIMERSITPMDISSSEYDDTLSMGIFKLSKSVNANATLKLDYTIREKYNASMGKSRLKSDASASKPISYFVENVTENSSNLVFMVNPYISEKIFVDIDGMLHSKVRMFGKKLTDNINTFEREYIIKNNALSTNVSATTLMAPIKLAKSSIESYRNIIKQAGVSPFFIKSTFNLDEENIRTDYERFAMADSLYPFGVYSSAKNTSKIIGNLPAKLERALDLVKNDEEYTKIDIIPEAGLGTIYVYSKSPVLVGEASDNDTFETEIEDGDLGDDDATLNKLLFDPTIVIKGIEDLRTGRSSLSDEANDVIQDYLSVIQKFYSFCNAQANGGRGDSFFIGDVLRGILIKGKDTKISSLFGTRLDNSSYSAGDEVNHSFSTSILYPIKHLFDTVVSSYGSTYAQWLKVLDNASGEKIWVPISGYVGAMMGRSDSQSGPWLAAAGLNRGVINALDCAFSPNQDQRTDLYKLCINAVPKIPNKGITIFGIRTMSKKASAFDQNTCRRTFLYMENTVKRYMRNYVFEPNTAYTRLQIVNDIEPFLESVANSGGIYSWSCVCDSSNNTPDIINNGDLAVDIAAAPTRTAENIILNFTANKYTSDISNTEL